jgi:hypothetical protein
MQKAGICRPLHGITLNASKFAYKSYPRAKSRECPREQTYFFGAIASFAALATRNFTTVLALI